MFLSKHGFQTSRPVHIASFAEPPLRLLLGSDGFRFVQENDLAKLRSDRKWQDLSIFRDFTDVELLLALGVVPADCPDRGAPAPSVVRVRMAFDLVPPPGFSSLRNVIRLPKSMFTSAEYPAAASAVMTAGNLLCWLHDSAETLVRLPHFSAFTE